MNSKNIKIAAAFLVFIGVVLGFQVFSFDNAAEVFAKAVESVKQAKTLSCIERYEGQKTSDEYKKVFKAPDLMRITLISADINKEFLNETTIVNYSKRKGLIVQPNRKKAILVDKSSEYEVNSKTGKVEPSGFDMSLRDLLLDLTAKAVKDLGTEKLNNKEVRKLRSKDDRKTTTVWVDPKTDLPVQIELQFKKHKIEFSEIKIDQPVDNSLFSLAPPDGYEYIEHISKWPDEKKRLSARIKFLLAKCWEYAAKNNDRFPQTLAELESTGLSKEALQNILHADNSSFEYVKPELKEDTSSKIAIYESFDNFPKDGIVVGFLDVHSELISSEQTFEQILAGNNNISSQDAFAKKLKGPMEYDLPDGSKVQLFDGAVIALYHDTHRRGFIHIGGEINVKVAKGSGKFVVTTDMGNVTALGTEFKMDIVTAGTSDQTLAVKVTEGTVEVSNSKGMQKVKASQSVIVAKDSAPYDFTKDQKLPAGLVRRIESMLEAMENGDKQKWLSNFNIDALYGLANGKIKFSDHPDWFSGMSPDDASRFKQMLSGVNSKEDFREKLLAGVSDKKHRLYVRSVKLSDDGKHARASCVKKTNKHTDFFTPQWTYFDDNWWQTDD